MLLTPSLGVTQENQSASSASKQSSTGEALLQEELLTLTLPSILYLYFWKCLENTLFHTRINRNFVLPEYSTEQHRNPFTEAGWPRRAHQTMHQAHLPAVLEWVVVSYFRMNANPGHKWIWNARALCLLREFLEEGLGQGQGELELDGARRFYQFSILPPFYSFPEEQLSSSAVFFLMTALLSQECSACSCSALLHPLLILPALPMPIPALQFCTKTTWAASPGCKWAACKADPNSPSSRALWGHFFINLIPLRSAVVRNSGLIPTLISTIWFT